MNNDLNSVNGCRMLHAHKMVDHRGILCFAQHLNVIPFDIKRIFWIYNVGTGMTRGGHSHSTCSEAIFPVNGSFIIDVTDGIHHATVMMDDPSEGVLIPAGVWCELKEFTNNAVCLVAASQDYDATGYTNDFNEYLRQCK